MFGNDRFADRAKVSQIPSNKKHTNRFNHSLSPSQQNQDTLKVSGTQVSPVEIENTLLSHPSKLISDVSVAGVSGFGRTPDEKVPRAWIVLNSAGKKLGEVGVIGELERWHKENLSKYKWLRGGMEVVDEVRCVFLSWIHLKVIVPSTRYRNHLLVKYYEGFFKIDMS